MKSGVYSYKAINIDSVLRAFLHSEVKFRKIQH